MTKAGMEPGFVEFSHSYSSEDEKRREYRERRKDNEELTDPGPRGGPLGTENEMPEGGDSTRFPATPPPKKDDRAA